MEEWDKENGNKTKALTMLMEATITCPLSIEINRRIADGCAVFIASMKDFETKETLKAMENHFRTISEGLLKSIVATGDGKTPKTAYKVISIPEEYMTLWYLGLRSENQSVGKFDGITCDVFQVKNQKNGERSTVYFDITIFHDKPPANPQKEQTKTKP